MLPYLVRIQIVAFYTALTFLREQTGAQVNRHSCNVHRKYTTFGEMWAVWVNNCVNGLVSGPLHPDSVIPMVISRGEIARRIAAESTRRIAAETARRQAAAAAVVAAADRRADTQNPAPQAAVSRASFCQNVASSVPKALHRSESILASQSLMRPPPYTTPSESADGSVDHKGKGPAGLSIDERRALLYAHSNNLPQPVAWVVVRGTTPGVYTSRYVE